MIDRDNKGAVQVVGAGNTFDEYPEISGRRCRRVIEPEFEGGAALSQNTNQRIARNGLRRFMGLNQIGGSGGDDNCLRERLFFGCRAIGYEKILIAEPGCEFAQQPENIELSLTIVQLFADACRLFLLLTRAHEHTDFPTIFWVADGNTSACDRLPFTKLLKFKSPIQFQVRHKQTRIEDEPDKAALPRRPFLSFGLFKTILKSYRCKTSNSI